MGTYGPLMAETVEELVECEVSDVRYCHKRTLCIHIGVMALWMAVFRALRLVLVIFRQRSFEAAASR